MAITPSNPTPRSSGGRTNVALAQGFVAIDTSELIGLAEEVERLADAVDSTGERAKSELRKAVVSASKPILREYKKRVGNVTGNLARSTKTITRKYRKAVVAVSGPEQTGNRGASDDKPSGNHSWLVEFGSGPRRPGTQNRRTYINTHQAINGKMSRAGSLNDEQFQAKGRGYYFLMGSINEPTRQARMGSGYPHDFGSTNGKMHPITLGPGETYGAMPAKHHMENSINAARNDVQAILEAELINAINRLSGGVL